MTQRTPAIHFVPRRFGWLAPDRGKRGFGTPLGAWLKRDLAPMLRSVLSPASLERRGLFRPHVVQKLIADHASNRIDGTDRLLTLLNLEIWSRVYLDGRTPNDVSSELRETGRRVE